MKIALFSTTLKNCAIRKEMGNRIMRVLALVAVCLLMCAKIGHAQTEANGYLQGVDKVRLVIEPLDDQSKACGITEKLIQEAFMFPVSSSALKVSNSDDGAEFYVHVTTIHNTAGCFSNINYRLYSFEFVQPNFLSAPRFLQVVYWNKESMMGSEQYQHGKMVRDDIEVNTKQFLTAWNLDNKPHRDL